MNIFANDIYLRYFAIPKWLAREFLEPISKVNNQIAIECLVIEGKNNINHKCHKNNKQKELLLKMLSAININSHDFKCIAIDNNECENISSSYKANVIILLDDDIKCNNDNVFLCPHPYDILQDTSLKRQAWNTLQKVKLQIDSYD